MSHRRPPAAQPTGPLTRLPPEWRRFTDAHTGTAIVQWTAGPTMNHHCYFTNPSTTADGSRGVFISYRTGYPNVFTIDLNDGTIVQVSDRIDINPFSPAPTPDRPFVYISAGNCVYQLHLDTGAQRLLARVDAPRLGNCSLNSAATLLAIGARDGHGGRLLIIDTHTGEIRTACKADEVGHVQFCPVDDDLLLFSGTPQQRLWCHRRSTARTWQPYIQQPDEWLVHESWRGNSREIIFSHWPHALRAVQADGRARRTIAALNAWHACSNRRGDRIVCDTHHPDRGLLLIDPDTGHAQPPCHPGASQRGTQWAMDRPATGAGIDTSILRSDTPAEDPPPAPEDPETTYGPQWSHPHPTFVADGRRVIFTSDRDRHCHVYSAAVPSG